MSESPFHQAISQLINALQAAAPLSTGLRRELAKHRDDSGMTPEWRDAVTLEAAIGRAVRAVRKLRPPADEAAATSRIRTSDELRAVDFRECCRRLGISRRTGERLRAIGKFPIPELPRLGLGRGRVTYSSYEIDLYVREVSVRRLGLRVAGGPRGEGGAQ